MPASRVTIASNSNQSQKAPLLIPSSASTNPAAGAISCHSLVVKTAQSKLRLKKASRIFAHGGKELKDQKDWEDVLTDDAVLLVSIGEEYVGSKVEGAEAPSQEDGQAALAVNPDCPIEILAAKAGIDPTSVTQLETAARTLPGMAHAVGQPDLHPGTKFPIGSVFVSKGWIHPPLIGGDIGCGMAWYKTKLSRNQVEDDKGKKIAEKLRGLEGPWRTQEDREIWLGIASPGEGDRGHYGAGAAWDKSLGTIGAGNHFAELQVVEEVATPCDEQHEICLYEGEVILLVHSGSRGYGGDILKRHTSDGRTSIHEIDPLATRYLREHDLACNWASRNRDLIALRFLSVLEPGYPCWSQAMESMGDDRAMCIRQARAALTTRKVVDILHNNVSLTSWPPHPTNDPKEKHYIHRKGAAPTTDPHTGEPLDVLPLPGSRATPSLILHPTFGEADDYGRINALSLAHGAGRALSRTKAATYVAEKYAGKAEDLLRGDFVRSDKHGNKQPEDQSGRNVMGGTWVVCEDKQLVWEEAGEAYKNVWDVGEDLVSKGCAERRGWCRAVVSYKMRKD